MQPDFNSSVHDHARILILVHELGESLPDDQFKQLSHRICQLENIFIPSHERALFVRARTNYTLNENEWGEFQVHRAVLGLLVVAACPSSSHVPTIYNSYKAVCAQYQSSIYDARLLLFGPGIDEQSPPCPTRRLSTSLDSGLSLVGTDLETSQDTFIISSSADSSPSPSRKNGVQGSIVNDSGDNDKQETKSQKSDGILQKDQSMRNYADVLRYPSATQCPTLEQALREFYTSLFWVLEAKRMDRSGEKSERLALLAAPNERLELVGLDTDTRSYKKRCLGRLKKRYGDLNLLANAPGEAILHYQTGADLLRTVGDWLWLAGCLEGLCAAHVLAAMRPGLTRNKSFAGQTTPPTTSKEIFRVSSSSNFAQSTENGVDVPSHFQMVLPHDIENKYQEALVHYAKFRNMSHIETEATFKAVKIFAWKNKRVEAAELLVNAGLVQDQNAHEEKVRCYTAIGDLFHILQMERKAALFWRVAAMQSVAPKAPTASWPRCYSLLLKTLAGFRLDKEQHSGKGWTVLQLRVMHELIYSARKMGNRAAAIKHLCWLLHLLCEHLNTSQQTELIQVLQSYTKQSSSPVTTSTLTRFPTLNNFAVQTPKNPPINEPSNSKRKENISNSPFIYSPINFAARRHQKTSGKVGFPWIAGEQNPVKLTLLNPLSITLEVHNLQLLTEGVEVEQVPVKVELSPVQASSTATDVFIYLIPQTAGTLLVTGYKWEVFGCVNNCIFDESSTIEVLIPLPNLSLNLTPSSNVHQEDNDITAEITLYTGQSGEYILTILNDSDIPVENILITSKKEDLETLSYQVENLQTQLPIQPGANAALTLYLSTHKVGRVDASLVVEYTTGEEQEWWRQARVQLQVVGDPVLQVQQLSVSDCPTDHGQFRLTLELLNTLPQEVKITEDIRHRGCTCWTVASKTHLRLEVDLPRCPIDVDYLQVPAKVETYLRDRLELKWQLDHRQGQLPIAVPGGDNVLLSAVTHPIKLDIAVNSKVCWPNQVLKCKLADKVNVQVTLHNITGFATDVTLRVKPTSTSLFTLSSPLSKKFKILSKTSVNWNVILVPLQEGFISIPFHCYCQLDIWPGASSTDTGQVALSWTFSPPLQLNILK